MTRRLPTSLACVLVASMVTIGIAAATPAGAAPSPRPKLVVGIFVKGLSADYIDLLRSNFGHDGFNRVMAEGLTIENVDYGPGIDATAATAMLVTGAAPGVNGVPSDRVWNASTRTDIPVLLDPEKAGSYTDRDLSPARLLVSTVSDEVRIADGGLGTVHALAADPQIAVILGSHAGNTAFWISDVDGKWTSASHFRDIPTAIARRNVGLTLSSRLDTMAWEPAIKLDRYPDLPDYKKLYPFRITFPSREPNRFKAFKASAPGNREIASAATELISTIPLGTRAVTDMISVGFDLSPYLYTRDADNRIETMDAYIRLDSDIANIIQAIEKGPGMDRTLLFIAGTPAPTGGRRDDEKWAIPSGTFSPRKAVSLLNVYLMAIHGNGQWVNGYYNGFFHLDSKLAKDRGIDIADLRRECADFLSRLAGVSEVYTIDDILARRAGDNPVALERNISAPHAGDLLVTVNPGWEISDGEEFDSSVLGETRLPVVRWQATTSPVFIMAPSVEPAVLSQPVDARAIAPTVSRILRIRSPNAAKLPPLK
ncbi:MAG: alkaline phosphatase family protein [Muribaculaceae bacterium]|nr:alkaline phosphatase family protein [Muribaculaceae bacterium]